MLCLLKTKPATYEIIILQHYLYWTLVSIWSSTKTIKMDAIISNMFQKGFPSSYQCWLEHRVGWQLAQSERERESRGSRDILLVPHYYPGIQPTALAHSGTALRSENNTNRAPTYWFMLLSQKQLKAYMSSGKRLNEQEVVQWVTVLPSSCC